SNPTCPDDDDSHTCNWLSVAGCRLPVAGSLITYRTNQARIRAARKCFDFRYRTDNRQPTTDNRLPATILIRLLLLPATLQIRTLVCLGNRLRLIAMLRSCLPVPAVRRGE